MTDKTKNIIKWSGVGAMVAGAAAVWIGGGDESYALEIVSSVFAGIGVVALLIKNG